MASQLKKRIERYGKKQDRYISLSHSVPNPSSHVECSHPIPTSYIQQKPARPPAWDTTSHVPIGEELCQLPLPLVFTPLHRNRLQNPRLSTVCFRINRCHSYIMCHKNNHSHGNSQSRTCYIKHMNSLCCFSSSQACFK